MSFREPKSSISKKSFDGMDVDNHSPNFEPYFKRQKVEGLQKFPANCGTCERSAQRFTDAKTYKRSISPLKPLNYEARSYNGPRRELNTDRRLAFDDKSIGVPLKHGAVSSKLVSSSQQSLSCSLVIRPPRGWGKVSSQVEPNPSIGTGYDHSEENEVLIRAIVGETVPNYKGDAFHAPRSRFNDSDRRLAFKATSNDVVAVEVPLKHGAVSGKLKSSSQQSLSRQEKVSFPREISFRENSQVEPKPSKNLDHKLGKVDDSGQKMTSEACVKLDPIVEQKPAFGVTCAHSIEEGAHARAVTLMKDPKNVVRENSLHCHAHSEDLVNHLLMIGPDVLKNTLEDNSSKCQREPSSVLNGESCKMACAENTFGSKPQAEENAAGFSLLGKYSGQKPNLKPLDLGLQDDEKMVRSLEENRKGKIAEEMDGIDLESSFVDNATAEKLNIQVTDCEAIPGNCGYQQQVDFQHLFSDKIIVVNMQGEARVPEPTFNSDKHRCFYYVADHGVADDHIQKLKQWKDCLVLFSDRYHAHDSRKRVIQALELFNDVYTVRLKAYKAEHNHGDAIQKTDVRTAMALKDEQKWVNYERDFVGHVPGVHIGDQFGLRAELAIVGLHHTFFSGIHSMKIQGKNYAISIVDSGRYDNHRISQNSFIYVGHGGNPSIAGKEPEDQKLKYGNLAMKNSRDKGVPVRVIRAHHVQDEGDSNSNKRYVYEGLFVVTKYWQERAQHGKMVFLFELHRISSQRGFTHQMAITPKKVGGWYHRQALKKGRPFCNGKRTGGVYNSSQKLSTKHCQALERVVIDDVSQGKENLPIRVVSDIYAERPPPFTYTVNMIYPEWYHLSVPLSCDCTDGCYDSIHCSCAIKNGGEIPFNRHGVKPKAVIHECGPFCKCPPSCRNRISQHGVRYRLEIFRKKPSGWGVRSRDYISAGSFVCEFIGELLDKEEAEKRIGQSEYFFHIGNSKKATLHDSCTDLAHISGSSSYQGEDDNGYKIDAARWGNVSRFINRSSSPNLYVQNVVYDDYYEDVPHIMLFACKNIPPMQEFTYDNNYS